MKKKRSFKKKLRNLLMDYKASWYHRSRKGSDQQKKLIIFGQGRTGSTLLEDLICSSGHFQKNGEPLNPRYYAFKEGFSDPLKRIIGLSRATQDNYACHVKVYHLLNRSGDDAHRFLKGLQDDGWHIVYLSRSNKLKLAVSSLYARARGSFHKFKDDDREDVKIEIEGAEIVKRIQNRLAFEKEEKEALEGLRYTEVVYEEDLENSANHETTVNRILAELGLPPTRVETRHKKVNYKPLKEVISNYKEITDALQQNGLSRYIEQ